MYMQKEASKRPFTLLRENWINIAAVITTLTVNIIDKSAKVQLNYFWYFFVERKTV